MAVRVTANTASSHRDGRDGAPRGLCRIPQGPRPGDGPRDAETGTIRRIYARRVEGLVRSFFEELPARQREIFDLVDLQGHRPSEVAEMLEMNPSTVRANLFKARRVIRREILRDHPELEEGYGG